MVYRVETTDLRLYRLYNVQYNVHTQYRNGESDISREYDVLHILSTSHSMGTLSQILHVQDSSNTHTHLLTLNLLTLNPIAFSS